MLGLLIHRHRLEPVYVRKYQILKRLKTIILNGIVFGLYKYGSL